MTDRIAEWRDEHARMRAQDLGAMTPHDRAVYAVAAAAHRDALARPWAGSAADVADALRLAAEFEHLLDAALCLQEMETMR